MEKQKEKKQKKNKIKKNEINEINEINDLSQSAVLSINPKLNMPTLDEPSLKNDKFIKNSVGDSSITTPHKIKKIKKIIRLSFKKNKQDDNNNNSNKEGNAKKKNNNDIKKKESLTLEKMIKIQEFEINDEKNEEKNKINSNEKKTNNKNKDKKEEKKNKSKKIKNMNSKEIEIKKNKIDEELIKKYNILIKSKIIFDLKNIFKIIYIFIKTQNILKNSVNKISNIYRGYSFRENFKLNYLTKKILEYRDLCASKIIAHYKGYNIRKISKKILQKKEDYYIIYSTLSNNEMLYFKVKYISGLEDNIYFEYCKLLNCFVYFISRREKNFSKKKVEGFFYNEKYNKLTDDMYEKNERNENIINFPKILKKNDENSEKYDKIINEYIKAHRPVKNKRINIDEYEERKQKALDDDMILNRKKFGDKLNKMSRSKSFMRLKGVGKCKGILKPSKSFINLRCDEKKIQFGQAKIKKYQNKKKY